MSVANAITVTSSLTGSFVKALRTIWQKDGARPRMGLAISGGVDSMALASLCHRCINFSAEQPAFVGFIVDHRLRDGSTEEVYNVAKELRRLKIEPRILTLDWTAHGDPSSIVHLESVARRLRYQAIGHACRAQGINTLLVAHHADDQAETVLMRLCGKYFGSGLQGIRTRKAIPECQGIYGVDRSGSPHAVSSVGDFVPTSHDQILIEDGGVTICRPLLPFGKDELITHCQTLGVRWFEDHTNVDPQYTMRNTVRYLQRNDLLPSALRKERLLTLAASASQRDAEAEVVAEANLEHLGMSLDLRTGRATFSIPQVSAAEQPIPADVRHHKAMLLRRLLALVAPIDRISMQDANDVAKTVLSEHLPCELNEKNVEPGVAAHLAGISISRSGNTLATGSWHMQRTAPSRKERVSRCVTLSTSLQQRDDTQDEYVASHWELWDNRYWLRIYRHSQGHACAQAQEVNVRFLNPDDITKATKTMHSAQLKSLRRSLDLAPGKLRYTLPALLVCRQGKAGRSVADEELVALPSLGWSAEDWSRWPSAKLAHTKPSTSWHWDIRFKHIDLKSNACYTILADFPTSTGSDNFATPRAKQQYDVDLGYST